VSIPSSRCAAPALGRARNLRRICLGNPLGVVHLLNARNHSVGARTRLPPLTRLRARQNTVGMAAKTCSPDCEERGEQDVCIDQRGGGDPPSTRGCGRGPVHQAWAASRAARQLSVTRPVPRNGPGRVRCSRLSDLSARSCESCAVTAARGSPRHARTTEPQLAAQPRSSILRARQTLGVLAQGEGVHRSTAPALRPRLSH
jgi:hypothetical protein